jgi:TRAP-type C4-dicarboxylate transport system permease small subunit
MILAVAIVAYTLKVMGVAQRQTSPGLGIRFDLIYFGQVLGGLYLAFSVLRKAVLGAPESQKTNVDGIGK